MSLMSGPMLSSDQLAILATGIMVVQKDAERRRGLVLCADGKTRRFEKMFYVDLIDKLGTLAGHEAGFLKEQGLELAKEVKK